MSRLRSRIVSHLPMELRQFLRRKMRNRPIFDDSFADWNAAAQASTGYGTDAILQKVLDGTMAVYRGEGVFERDSVVFKAADYSWPVLSAFLWAAASKGGVLNVLDFGGALGSSYFQNVRFLEQLTSIRWSIVEQPSFVEAGRRNLADSPLQFYADMQECVDREHPHMIYFGSSLQYVEDPWRLLAVAAESDAQFLLIDRTPASDLDHDLFAVQGVPSWIYPASYPARIFSSSGLRHVLSRNWEVVAEYDWFGGGAWTRGGVTVAWRGWLCCRKTPVG